MSRCYSVFIREIANINNVKRSIFPNHNSHTVIPRITMHLIYFGNVPFDTFVNNIDVYNTLSVSIKLHQKKNKSLYMIKKICSKLRQ